MHDNQTYNNIQYLDGSNTNIESEQFETMIAKDWSFSSMGGSYNYCVKLKDGKVLASTNAPNSLLGANVAKTNNVIKIKLWFEEVAPDYFDSVIKAIENMKFK